MRDLAETAPRNVELVLADRDTRAARKVAAGLPRRVRVVEIDAGDPDALARRLPGTTVVVNTCHHDFNLRLMDAALAIGCHYLDLGGLFHVTRQQLQRHREFNRAGLLALCGMGSAPGIVNVMARAGAARLDRVESIHIAVGTSAAAVPAEAPLLDTPYSIQTVLDEASRPAAIFAGGALRFVPPLSGAEPVDFPPPVGRQYPAFTLHSELATLPASFRSQGVRDISFRIAFPGGLADRLRFVHALGLTGVDPVAVDGTPVVPRKVLLALLRTHQTRRKDKTAADYEVLRVTLRGRRDGRTVEDVLDCHVPGLPAWGVGVDIDTGAPPSIMAQMMVSGAVVARGVLPPERVVEPEPFFRELRRRGMRFRRRVKSTRASRWT
jgi:saccharopine dehydrogenase-like NADP-dependent oxidoreductase